MVLLVIPLASLIKNPFQQLSAFPGGEPRGAMVGWKGQSSDLEVTAWSIEQNKFGRGEWSSCLIAELEGR